MTAQPDLFYVASESSLPIGRLCEVPTGRLEREIRGERDTEETDISARHLTSGGTRSRGIGALVVDHCQRGLREDVPRD